MKILSRSLLMTAPAALLLLCSTASHAAIDEQGAETLKTLLQQRVNDQKQMSAAVGATVETSGEVVVTPKDTYYNAVLPAVKTTYEGGVIYELGKIVVNAIPDETGEEWKIALALPSDIYMTDRSGEKITVHLGSQKASGIWNTKLNTTTKFRGEYQDITVTGQNMSGTPDAKPVNAKIKTVTVNQDFDKDASGEKFSGPMSLVANGIELGVSDQEKLTISEVSAKYVMKDVSLATVTKVKEQMKQIGVNSAKTGESAQSPIDPARLLNTFVTILDNPLGEVTSDLVVSNLEVRAMESDPVSGEKVPTLTGIKSINYGIDMNMADPAHAGFGLRLGMEGLSIDSPKLNEDQKKYLPQKIAFDLKASNIPAQELLKSVSGQFALMADPTSTAVPDQAPKSPQELLALANAKLDYTLQINSAAAKVNGKGTAAATLNNMLGLTSDQTFEIEGLDNMITELKTNPQMTGILQPLAMIQMMGQQNQDNPQLRTYHLVVDEQGQVTMNGADMSAMIGDGVPQ